MLSNQITVADVAKLANVTRHKVRSMTRDLPGFNDRAGLERIATQYNEHDLAVLAACFELEERYGIRRETLGALVAGIRKAFSGPKPLASGAFLLIVPHANTVKYLDKWTRFDEGLLFPLDALVQRIDAYLGRRHPSGAQGQLHLGPVVVGGAAHQLSSMAAQESRRAVNKSGAGK